jgi:hypothetical protein
LVFQIGFALSLVKRDGFREGRDRFLPTLLPLEGFSKSSLNFGFALEIASNSWIEFLRFAKTSKPLF